jgi:hypothetical protein
MTKPTNLYLLSFLPEADKAFILWAPDGGIQIWESFNSLQDSIVRTGGMLKPLNPWPIRVSSTQYKGIEDYYLNNFILDITDSERLEDLNFLEIASLILMECNKDKLKPYMMTPITNL